jgi:hypothetical protein
LRLSGGFQEDEEVDSGGKGPKAKIKAFWESDYKPFEVPDDTPREQSTRSEFEMFLEGRSQKDPLAPLDEYDKWCQLEPFEHHNALSY